MKLTVIGTGYVGLVSGACLAEMGNTVTCLDVDERKIEGLGQGVLPIYEPGLEALVINNQREGRLSFTTSYKEAVAASDIYFIAVGTPPGEDGSADLRHVLDVAGELGSYIDRYCAIATKSTVPVGTAEKIRAAVEKGLRARGVHVEFDVASNPEFLKEGAAVEDFMKPDRIVIGCDCTRAREIMHDIYAPFTRSHERMIFMSVRAAEMTKYAANAMLATKISFMNEVAELCDGLGVDVESVRQGIGADPRIGYSFIYPGAGYGGSCFPKDVKAMIRMAEENGVEPGIIRAVENRNEYQKTVLFRKLVKRLGGDLTRMAFALWGLAFKPGTDDMREASAVALIRAIIGAGGRVKAFDPAAMGTAKRELPAEWFNSGRLELVENQYDALAGADALFLVTEWKAFRNPDYERMKALMKRPLVLDGRNIYDPEHLGKFGFEYEGIGR